MASTPHIALVSAFPIFLLAMGALNVFMTVLLLTKRRELAASIARVIWPYVRYLRLGEN